jgi:dUTP pyrophosphatase
MAYRHWYRLEILPSPGAECLYQQIVTEDRTDDNAGVDLYCAENLVVSAESTEKATLVHLGLRARLVKHDVQTGQEADSHYWLVPRSSICKTPLQMANSVGVIDKTYRGELMAPVRSTSDTNISVGQRLFQIVAPDMGWIWQVRIVDNLPTSVRGEGGFGSTGK